MKRFSEYREDVTTHQIFKGVYKGVFMKKQLSVAFLALSSFANSTTWGELEVDDPIVKGAKCKVAEPASYGGYIYSWPSKYDQVFWPHTDRNGIWYCETSGFIALIGDFDELKPAEIDRITEFLSSQHISKPTLEQKLALLEQTYALREKDEFFKNKLLRILARWQQSLGNLNKANSYRARAFQEIQHALNGDLDGYKRLEYLYLATNYSKQFAEQNKNVSYLDDLETALKSVTDPELKGYAGYLSELIKDSTYINEGGKLDPDLPKQ